MKKSIFLIFLIYCGAFQAHCQDENEQIGLPQNIIYVNAGSWVYVSTATLNYERHIVSSASNKFHLFGQVGAGVGYLFYDGGVYGGVLGTTLLTGQRNSHFT